MVRSWLATLVVVALVNSAALAQRGGMSYGKAPTAPVRDPDPTKVGIDQHIGEQVPLELVFRDEHDQPVKLGDCIGGKPTILVLAYYRCPQLCNLVLNELTESLRKVPQYSIGEQFNVVTVSFDPKDKPAIAWGKKQSYLQLYGRPDAERGWHFLTGEQSAIDELCRAVGFRYEYDAKTKEYYHASGIMLLTPEGKLSRYFYGVQYESRDIRFGLADASEGKTFDIPVKEQVLMLCYRYDPHTGKYSPDVMLALRIGAGITVLVLGTWVLRVWRRSGAERGAAALLKSSMSRPASEVTPAPTA
jgi:protein SCO1/2